MKIILFIILQIVIVYFFIKGIKLIINIKKNKGKNMVIRTVMIIIGLLILIAYFVKHFLALFNKNIF